MSHFPIVGTPGLRSPGAFLILLLAPAITSAATHTVRIENMKFDPPELTVHRGDTVVWQNFDIVPHTVTSSEKKPAFDSGTILSQKSFTHRFKTAKTYAYVCRFHPTMKATLIVSP